MRKLIAFALATILAVTSLSAMVFAADDATVHLDFTNLVFLQSGEQLVTAATTVHGETPPNKIVYIQLDSNYTWNVKEQTDAAVAPFVPGVAANATGVPEALGKTFADTEYFKLKSKKGEDNKTLIKKMSVIETKLDNSTTRHAYIKIELFDNYTDKEYKITPEFTFTARKTFYIEETSGRVTDSEPIAPIRYATVPKGTEYVIKSDALQNGAGPQQQSQAGAIYISNELIKNTADKDWAAGTGGYVVKPVKNEENFVTWEDEIRTIAWLKFDANSDSNTYFPKLSTKWDNADYADLFVDQDAFIYTFTGTPKISSTSRATLSLYNPYFDDDYAEKTGNEAVAEEDIVIYEVNADGELIDVTKEFKFEENEDGVAVLTTKTRVLGTYIVVEKTLWEAKQEEPEMPPETGGGSKGVPNTGC